MKAHLDSLSPEELRSVRPDYYWLRFGQKEWLDASARKAYHPDQPRVPAGNPDGGQWTRVAGPFTGRGPARLGANFPGATYGQLVRLDQAIARTERALEQIGQRDADWRPTTTSLTAPGSINGAIRNAEARAEEAEARLDQLRSGIGGNFGPPLEPAGPRAGVGTPSSRAFDGPAWIDAYRAANNMPDLFGRATWPLDRGTVAAAEVNGSLYFGTNSGAPTYTDADARAATRMRDSLIEKYPETVERRNVGEYPNNALYHAETTILLRAASDNGGSLERRSIEVHVDRITCLQCKTVLPLVGVELGNPMVTFVERDSGLRSTMWNGRWLTWRNR